SGDKGNLVYEEGKYIGITTNNVAEYTGVLEALKKIQELFTQKDLTKIQFYMDSKLAVEQLSGRYRVKSLHLKPLIEEIRILVLQLGGVVFTHVPRAKNAQADRLANFALDNR
ncbi:ribonuclease HI family protein, partial [Patescibacteria group bacterium]|nr:ribonuclease HI family protein [Patescibacteria group bacterium]